MEKYKITVEKLVSYDRTTVEYEASDGNRYVSTYAIPEGLDYKQVTHLTGETGWTNTDIYEQTVDTLKLDEVIKAVNNI